MCLISISPKNTSKNSDFFLGALEKGMKSHSDGTGFAYKNSKTGGLYFHKGIQSFGQLMDAFKHLTLKDEDELVVHSRTASYGSKTLVNTHPFILNDIDLKNDMAKVVGPGTTKFPVMFHNGSMMNFKGNDPEHSDTYNFGNNFMRIPEIYHMFLREHDKFKALFGNLYGSNKFAFMSPRHDVKIIGDFLVKNTYMFSNASYQTAMQSVIGFGNIPTKLTDAKQLIASRTAPFKSPNNVDVPINLRNLTINQGNWDEFIIRASKDIEPSKFIKTKIEAGSKFFIRKYNEAEDEVMLEDFNKASSYIPGVPLDVVKENFGLIPKGEYSKKYTDLMRLFSVIPGTKSAVKKHYAKFVTHSNRAHNKDTITIKYGETKLDVLVMSLIMWFKEYEGFIDGYDLNRRIEKLGMDHLLVKS